MKILNVMFTTRKGGLEQAFLDYSDALRLQNFEIVQVVHTNNKVEESLKEKFYKVANFSKYDPISLFKLWKIVRKEKPDLIISHGNRAHYMMKKIGGSIKVIGISHGYSFDYIKNCDAIITVSQDIRNHLINSNYPRDKIMHIPNMIRIPDNLKYRSLKFNSPPIIGMMCRFDKLKGVDLFVEALHILKQNNIAFKAIIAGDGEESSNIKNLIKHLKLRDDITMLGWIVEKEKFYNNVDIVCIPSLQESFGLVVLEAFTYSKAVIVSNLPGPLEIVENQKDALVFSAGNIPELAKTIEQLTSDQKLANTLTYNGFNKAKSYELNNVSKLITNFLTSLKLQ